MIARALLLASLVPGCAGEAEPPRAAAPVRVHCAPLERREWAPRVLLRGTVAAAPDHHALVTAQVPGRLERVTVREGDRVTRDQVVAQIERRALDDALREAEAEMLTARAAHEAADAQVAREAYLVGRGFSAQQTLDQSRASLAQSQAAVVTAAAKIDAAQQDLGRATVRSPIAGVVLRLLRNEGEVVDGTAATPLLEVADPTFLEMGGSVSAGSLVTLAPGQPATITFDALPRRTWRGRVRAVAPAIDPTSGVGTVRVALDASAVRPPFGLLGDVVVAVGEPRSVAVVPAAAVRSAGGAATEVVACASGRARVLRVTTGERREGMVELTSGASPPLRVATGGEVPGLEDGARIQVIR